MTNKTPDGITTIISRCGKINHYGRLVQSSFNNQSRLAKQYMLSKL